MSRYDIAGQSREECCGVGSATSSARLATAVLLMALIAGTGAAGTGAAGSGPAAGRAGEGEEVRAEGAEAGGAAHEGSGHVLVAARRRVSGLGRPEPPSFRPRSHAAHHDAP